MSGDQRRSRGSSPRPKPDGHHQEIELNTKLSGAGEATIRTVQDDVEVFFDDAERLKDCQEAFLAGGGLVPLEHHWRWIREMKGMAHWCVVVRDPSGPRVRAAVPAQVHPTWSFPGHHRLRVTRFGHGLETEALAAVLEGLRVLVEREGRLLSVNVEVFSPDEAHRERIARVARGQLYEETGSERRYRRTARIDLSETEDKVFGDLSGSCRRAIREPEKKEHRVRDIVDERWAPRMAELWDETFHRTGAKPPTRDWARHVAFARDHPELYRIVGTFAPEGGEPGSLMAFSCGMNNGDHAVYSDGASTRDSTSGVTLSYAPMWHLIRWAKRCGCTWFDMGGISEGTSDDDDPRGGISDFKRRFTRDVVEVGTEWVFEPASLRSWLSHRARTSASGVRSLLGGSR